MSTKPNRLFAFIAKYPRQILALALLFSAISVIYTIRNMTFLTGRDDLMPKNAPFQVDYRAYRAEFGDQEEIVAVIESDDATQATRAADALYTRLNRDKAIFRDIFYPGGLPFFRSNGLLFMPLEDIKKLRHTLTMAAPVLKDLAAAPSVQTLFTSLTGQIDAYLKSGDPAARASLTFMLTTLDKGFASASLSTGSSASPNANPVPERSRREGLSMDSFLKGGDNDKPSMLENAGKQQVITMLPVKEEGSFVASEKSIKAARAALNEILEKPEFKGVHGGLTGVPVLEYEEMATSKDDIGIATVLSLSLTVILLLFAFRGLLNVVAAMVSLIVGICLSFGFATLAVGHLNILSMVFAIMLIGLGIEYGIQVVLRYQEELSGGAGGMAAIETGLSANIRSIIMAAATVALAFATFAFTDFKGIAELGIIAAGGVFICVIATFTVLPAMLVLLERFRKPPLTPAPLPQDPLGPKGEGKTEVSRHTLINAIFARPRAVIAVTAALSLICLYPTLTMRFDYNLMNLQAKGLQSVEYAYKLMRSKENTGYFAVIAARDTNEAKILTERLEKLPAVDHVVSKLSFVPEQQREKLAELAALRQVMADVKPVPYEENLQPMALPAVFENFRDRVEKFKNELEGRKAPEARQAAAFLTTLDGFFKSLEKEKDKNALGMLREFQGSMFAELPDKLRLLKESLEAVPVTAADVPQQLLQRFVGKSGALLLQVTPRKEIFEREPLQEFVSQVKSIVPHATGEPVMVFESLSVLRNAYLNAFIYAFIGIAAILLFNFKSIRYALLGTVPLGAGLLLMIGGMRLMGVSFNSANIIVLPLILGVGIDSAIYIINRYRQGNETPAQVATRSAGIGVFLNALTILFSFGALMIAHHQGVFSIGAVMSLGMVANVAAFLIFLPALLTLWGKR